METSNSVDFLRHFLTFVSNDLLFCGSYSKLISSTNCANYQNRCLVFIRVAVELMFRLVLYFINQGSFKTSLLKFSDNNYLIRFKLEKNAGLSSSSKCIYFSCKFLDALHHYYCSVLTTD